LLPDTVPAPEVYGWREDDGQVFIYMELVNGITLEKSWDNTNKEDRIAVCHQLRRMVDA
jgi:aminoglycoside phosphotransferase